MTERRDSARYPTSWTGRLGGRKTALHVVDASEGGIFLAVRPVPPVGTTLIIEVVIGGRTVLLSGEVVRHVLEPGGAEPVGIGLRLLRKPRDWQDLVASLGAPG